MTDHQCCFSCGMELADCDLNCQKCDSNRLRSFHKQRFVVDIAHGHQTVVRATQEFDQALEYALKKEYGEIEFIVGRGRINKEVAELLRIEQSTARIKRYDLAPNNSGAFIAWLR